MRTTFLIFATLLLSPYNPILAAQVDADQGARWTEADRKVFYKADQGSRIMPYEWLAALKQKGGTPFLADDLTRYGYLKAQNDQNNLPVGFTVSGPLGSQTVGMTCAACHTRQISVDGNLYRIDGGPALVDFQSFLEDLDTAVGEALATDEAFKRFAGAVIQETSPSANDISALKQKVSDWYLRYHTIIELSFAREGQIRWGLGRLDAIAMIFNRVTGLDIGPPPSFIIRENIKPADAPARYPFLWNAPRQDKTQWAGFATNGSDLLALSRNIGQVLGVFAVFHPKKEGSYINFLNRNSVNFDGLSAIEELVKKIGPPKWPWPVDSTLAARGEAIYERECSECHKFKPGEVRFPFQQTWGTPVRNVGSDTRQYDILNRLAKSGALKGAYIPFATTPLKETDKALNILATSVIGSIAEHTLGAGGGSPSSVAQIPSPDGAAPSELSSNRLPPNLRDLEGAFRASAAPVSQTGVPARPAELPPERGSYEARVMQGIWAAAPYLHNGSVPTLGQLLLPPSQRAKTFKVGPEYDISEIGLSSSQPGIAVEYVTTDCSELNSGNSRCGHEYGTQLTPDEKKELLEYLKTL